jgi:hypothetical protein
MNSNKNNLNIAPRMLGDQVVSYDVVQQPVLNDPHQGGIHEELAHPDQAASFMEDADIAVSRLGEQPKYHHVSDNDVNFAYRGGPGELKLAERMETELPSLEKLAADFQNAYKENPDKILAVDSIPETEFEKSFKHHPMSDWRANITHEEIDAKDISQEAKEMMHASLRQYENMVIAPPQADFDGNVMEFRRTRSSYRNRGMGITRKAASKRKLGKKKK